MMSPDPNCWTIVANGPFLPIAIIKEAIRGRKVIATDGAADHLRQLNLRPDVIIGDFDSINPLPWEIVKTYDQLTDDDVPYFGHDETTIVPSKNQGKTDLQKAIEYCDNIGASHITIICALGGRLDQHEANLRQLRRNYLKQRIILMHSNQESIRYAKDETVNFHGLPGDYCGILAFPQAVISTHGLVYEAQQLRLNFGIVEGTNNQLKMDQVEVMVEGEALIIMPPQLVAQRLNK